ncbi:hypothetical protein V501_06075 [Pseudogymnoascus sp. VKM F-4519 (FW-2642)]|nr:hypothetical protein V501_06075 [Pseudogymnoascus sp. VKM F-4519 (FW-2642)]
MKNIFFTLASLIALVPAALSQCFPDTNTFSPIPYAGLSQVQFTSCPSQADGPRIFPLNATTFDWWYFDAVSSDGTQAFTVIFFTSSAIGFSFDFFSTVDPLNVWVFATFADGTPPAVFPVPAVSVTTTTNGDGASGDWKGSGISFKGAPDLSSYVVNLNNPLIGLTGTFTLKSRGPGHYNCGPLGPGQDEQSLPNIGWVNVMPGADAVVDVKVLGKPLKFTGHGYHDKNWGDVPFISALKSWYWGHASVGGYDLVFFDMIDPSGANKVGGYALKDGQVVASTCTTGVKIRPIDTPYPPTIFTTVPKALTLNMTLDDGSHLDAVLTQTSTQVNIGIYVRWVGTIEATIGGVTATGAALWEQFAVSAT